MPTDKRFTMLPHHGAWAKHLYVNLIAYQTTSQGAALGGELGHASGKVDRQSRNTALQPAPFWLRAVPMRSRLCSRSKPSRTVDEMRRQIAQARMRPILVRQNSLRPGQRPGNAKVRIIPRQAPIALGGVKIRHLVDHLGLGLERTKTVRKAFGYPQLRPVVGGEGCRNMSSKSR